MMRLVVLFLVLVFSAPVLGEYVWYETVDWLPSGDEALQVYDTENGIPDKVIVWNPAGNDFYLGVVVHGTAASDTASVDQTKCPASGMAVPGLVTWVVNSTATDTLQVLKYNWVERAR